MPSDEGTQDELGACHPLVASTARGAYFRKVVSATAAKYAAIHTAGTLPTVWFDGDRWFHTSDADLAYQNGPLDRPSVYLGGRASGTEVDAGLTWDRVYDAQGRATWTDVAGSRSDGGDRAHQFYVEDNGTVKSEAGAVRAAKLQDLRENFAFRPYWRVSRPDNTWHNPPKGTPENVYLYPGEIFRMQIRTAGKNQLRLNVNGAGGKSFEVTFDALGWGVGADQQWKRVHSIDQFTVSGGKRVGLESQHSDVLKTATHLKDMRWDEVTLLDSNGNEAGVLDCKAQAIRGVDTIFQSNYTAIFAVSNQDARGGESASTTPPY